MRFYLDFKSPAAYLAMRPTLALVHKHGLDVRWLPYLSSQQRVLEPMAQETRGETHRRVRALARRDVHLMYADIQGLEMIFPEHLAQTDLALCALLALKESPVDFILAAFRSYWVDHADLNDADVVRELLATSGQDPPTLDVRNYAESLARNQLDAQERGVVDVPAYVIGEQVFIGREHLPWIEQMVIELAA
ncbi:MAG: DsbA family protein [Pseudomonadales bacterium]|nr:DsbA family protein [Pseudomonadales bacterium]MDP6825615.1 DsbA family protein [Pseudomonadales bacterium]